MAFNLSDRLTKKSTKAVASRKQQKKKKIGSRQTRTFKVKIPGEKFSKISPPKSNAKVAIEPARTIEYELEQVQAIRKRFTISYGIFLFKKNRKETSGGSCGEW